MLSFKEIRDLVAWRNGEGTQHVRAWITHFNSICEQQTGKPAVVTSWYREDGTFHQDGNAVDFRRLSGANEQHPQYTQEDVEKIEAAAVAAGIPIVVVYRGTPREHWHCGDIAVKVPPGVFWAGLAVLVGLFIL